MFWIKYPPCQQHVSSDPMSLAALSTLTGGAVTCYEKYVVPDGVCFVWIFHAPAPICSCVCVCVFVFDAEGVNRSSQTWDFVNDEGYPIILQVPFGRLRSRSTSNTKGKRPANAPHHSWVTLGDPEPSAFHFPT